MWECFKRVIKPRGAVVLTASGKFTYKLVMSNFEWFKYEWVWEKTHSASFLNAKIRPLSIHEMVLIFGIDTLSYCPQMTKGAIKNNRSGTPLYERNHSKFGINSKILANVRNDNYYPKSVIHIGSVRRADMNHSTQKPVALFEYLIRTYTQPGEVVFDPCVGSGTTALAARNTGRNYICGDSSAEYVQVARDRLAQPYTLPLFDEQQTDRPKPEQMELI
jgi:site-specific DNA-methyltransferase (adenine-specific)